MRPPRGRGPDRSYRFSPDSAAGALGASGEFESVLKPGATPAVSLELLAYSMLGAMHNASLRASWDETFSREDLLAAHLWLYLAALAGLSGQVDIDSQMAHYKELIQQIAAQAPESPPPSE